MTTLATAERPYAETDAGRRVDLAPTIEVAGSLHDAAQAWRRLERDAVMSPYTRFDWVAAYAAAIPDEGRHLRVAVARDRAGAPVLVMPFVATRRFGLRVATAVGGKHANFNIPIMRPDFAAGLDPTAARALMRGIGRALRVDAITVANMPVVWNGLANPFAADGSPSPSTASSLRLERDGEATLARSMSNDARKKLRNKERGLAKHGAVALTQATDAAQVDTILAAFLVQKDQRFRALGIPDPFAQPGMHAFLRDGALSGLAEGRPAIELYGLSVGGRVVAVLGGAADDHRLSGMFVSYEDGELSKYSPGEILVTGIIRQQCARGRGVFDLGVGEARYKRNLLDTTDDLVDIAVPVTPAGRLYGAGHGALVEAKRRIKANPRAMRIFSEARRRLVALR